ncbi:MAG: DUF58 domain-containing protein, partial [Hydrogenophaga sp.]|uniref:DUF58 domain-containing protein n=1 Tax=Hydrogenophaga sp. TaxID=1904254 RepID=UPI001E061DB0
MTAAATHASASGWHWRHPLRPLRRRVQAWFHNRLRRTDTLTLTQRNVYILPTRAGWMLAVTLLVLLIASINYQLNLGYLLTFLLAGSALVGMHVCHSNLRGVSLHLNPPEPVHAHQALVLEVRLGSERRRPRHGIGLGVMGDEDSPPPLAWTDVPGQGQAMLQVAWKAPSRGLHALPTVLVQTLFPLGTFRVWSLWRPAATALVYPTPEDHPPPLPPGEPQDAGAGSARVHTTGEYDGVRAYRRGDPIKSVVWKKAAQAFASGRDELVSRDALSSQR